MNVRCVLGKPAYIVLCLNGQMTTYSGFADGASRYTMNLASTAWVLYSPTDDLVSSGGTCLSPATNNLAKYHAMIGFLPEALTSNVSQIRVYLDSELVVDQLNQVYTIRNLVLFRMFRRVGLLEKVF